MPKTKRTGSEESHPRLKPPQSPEEAEAQLTSLAYGLARKQLLEGTASAQVIVHFLKLSNERARLERVKLEHETKLLEAKTAAIAASAEMDSKYEAAVEAMRRYKGASEEVDPDADIF